MEVRGDLAWGGGEDIVDVRGDLAWGGGDEMVEVRGDLTCGGGEVDFARDFKKASEARGDFVSTGLQSVEALTKETDAAYSSVGTDWLGGTSSDSLIRRDDRLRGACPC